MLNRLLPAVALAAGLGMGSGAGAGVIVGGSELLTASHLAQLEAWLGSELTLTHAFAKGGGTDASDFHAAADGKGPTITVMEATEVSRQTSALIGGFSPSSWDASLNAYLETLADSDRTAFVFNLTTATMFQQRLSTDSVCGTCGRLQTYHGAAGPSFGGGMDIGVPYYLDLGSSYLHSYGRDLPQGTSVVDGAVGSVAMSIAIGRLEVFTVAPFVREPPVGSIPEPGTLSLAGLALVAAFRLRRRAPGTR